MTNGSYRLASALAALAVLGATAGPAPATQLVPAPNNCTDLNCKATVLPGRINGHIVNVPAPNTGIANPWVVQIAGKTKNCLRLEVTSQSTNLAMTAVAPDGQVFTDDNGGTCSNCPRVVIEKAKNGFYTVVVGTKSGNSAEADFTLKVGLYKAGNAPNCSSPTTGQ